MGTWRSRPQQARSRAGQAGGGRPGPSPGTAREGRLLCLDKDDTTIAVAGTAPHLTAVELGAGHADAEANRADCDEVASRADLADRPRRRMEWIQALVDRHSTRDVNRRQQP